MKLPGDSDKQQAVSHEMMQRSLQSQRRVVQRVGLLEDRVDQIESAEVEPGVDIGDLADGAKKIAKGIGKSIGKNAQLLGDKAGKAAQANNLLSRLTGSVLNPNLETLFEGPRTRSFNYQFQFTPRDEEEAVEVRKIIRTFKEAMAIQRTKGLSFLKAPYVFRIRYLYKGGDDHPYIGRVKGPCALKDLQTDYTPEGSYMTYEGGEDGGSMVKYTVTLVFQELDPIYADDYLTLGENSIGY